MSYVNTRYMPEKIGTANTGFYDVHPKIVSRYHQRCKYCLKLSATSMTGRCQNCKNKK